MVTDNDGNIDAVNKKYENYLGTNEKPNIKIFFKDGPSDFCGAAEISSK